MYLFFSISPPSPLSVMIELLSRAQACRVDDQRGLLTKEHLELPQFLLNPSVHDQETQQGEAGEVTGGWSPHRH